MTTRLRTCIATLLLGTSLVASAITLPELAQLRAGSTVQMPLAGTEQAQTEPWVLDAVGVFTDTDGSKWYRLESHRSTGDKTTAIVSISATDSDAKVVLKRPTLGQLHIQPRFLKRISKQGQGELTLDDKHYTYNDDDSDDAKFADAADPGTSKRVGYFWFHCKEDEDLSLLLLDWGDDNVEALQTESVEANQIVLNK